MAQGLHHSSLQLPISLVSFCQLKTKTKIPRWQQKEEAENMLPKVNLGEMLEIHLAGKTTKNRQNSKPREKKKQESRE
jgi:hypothetical protein